MVPVSFIQSVFSEKDSELAIEKVQRVSLFEKAGDEPLAQTDCSSDLPILRNRFHTSRGSSRISHVCNLIQATLASFVFIFLCFLEHFSARNIFMWKYQAWSFTKINKERAGDWTAGIPTWVEVSSKSGFFGWDLSNFDNCGWIEKQRQHSRYSGGFCLRNIAMLVEAGMELLSCDLSCLSSYPRSGRPEYLKEASI